MKIKNLLYFYLVYLILFNVFPNQFIADDWKIQIIVPLLHYLTLIFLVKLFSMVAVVNMGALMKKINHPNIGLIFFINMMILFIVFLFINVIATLLVLNIIPGYEISKWWLIIILLIITTRTSINKKKH